MALTIKHTKVSAIPDGTDPSVIRPSDWNADHALTGVATIAQGGTGQATANAAANALLPAQTGNAGKVLGTDGTNTSWVANGSGGSGVTQIVAGTNITIDPPSGVGNVTINATGGGSLLGQTQSVSPYETSLGFEAGNANTGANNTYLGYQAGKAHTGATNNVVIGYQAMDVATIPSSNVIIGASACGASSNTSQNVVIGFNAAGTTTALGSDSVIIGNDAGRTVTGTSNVLIGSSCGNNVTTGSQMIGIGLGCFGAATAAAAGAVAVGNNALGSLTTGAGNSVLGYNSANLLTTGGSNTCIGYETGKAMVTSALNTFIGYRAGIATTGGSNTIVGANVNPLLTSGAGNTFIGVGAGNNVSTGSNNTVIGNGPLPLASSSNIVALYDGVGDLAVLFNDPGAMTFDGLDFGENGQVLKSQYSTNRPIWDWPNKVKVVNMSTPGDLFAQNSVTFVQVPTATMTINLPNPTQNLGLTLTVKRTDASASNILTVATTGGLIEGQVTTTIGIGMAVTYCSDGTDWWELANS